MKPEEASKGRKFVLHAWLYEITEITPRGVYVRKLSNDENGFLPWDELKEKGYWYP